jgi:hypothetical protein
MSAMRISWAISTTVSEPVNCKFLSGLRRVSPAIAPRITNPPHGNRAGIRFVSVFGLRIRRSGCGSETGSHSPIGMAAWLVCFSLSTGIAAYYFLRDRGGQTTSLRKRFRASASSTRTKLSRESLLRQMKRCCRQVAHTVPAPNVSAIDRRRLGRSPCRFVRRTRFPCTRRSPMFEARQSSSRSCSAWLPQRIFSALKHGRKVQRSSIAGSFVRR